MTNPTHDPIALARIAADALYNFPDLASAIDYFQSELMLAHDATITTRHDLRDCLDNDRRDLIHNANLSDLIPAADDMNDDDYTSLADFIRDDDDFLNHLTLIIAHRISI